MSTYQRIYDPPINPEQSNRLHTTGSIIMPTNQSRINMNIDPMEIFCHETPLGGNLGTVYKARYNSEDVALRKIKFNRISAYAAESFTHEIQMNREIILPHVLPLLGGYHENNMIGVMMPFMENGSLYSSLHDKSHRFTEADRIRIARELAISMEEIYKTGRSHGDLRSENILFDQQWRVFVSGLGLTKIKKYAWIMNQYSNKSAWSSPEVLEKRKVTYVTDIKESDDVFSFGTILWELYTENIPFEGWSVNQIAKTLVQEKLRLQMTERVSRGVQEVIKSSWNIDADARPNFSLIVQMIKDNAYLN